MSTTEMSELRRTIGQLRQCVAALRGRYGEATPVQRLLNDLERLEIDASELDRTSPVPTQTRGIGAGHVEVVPVPDTPYDPSLWEGADDEGVGGYLREQR